MSELMSVNFNPNKYDLYTVASTEDANPIAQQPVVIGEVGGSSKKSSSSSIWDNLQAMGNSVAVHFKAEKGEGRVGFAACTVIAESIDNYVPTSGDAGVPDAGDGGPDAADADTGVCVDNDAPGSFGTNQPMNNATGVSLRPTFGWAGSIDPNGDTVNYTLLIDTNENFTAPVTFDASSLTEYTLADPLATDTTYYWRVVANDPCDATTESQPTPAFSFTTLADCSLNPGTFNLVDPADQADWVSLTPTFDWTDSLDLDPGDSVQYRLEIADNAQFNNSTVYSGLTGSTYTLSLAEALANGQTYYWRVFAEDDCQNEVASTSTYEFSTEPACIPQTVVETDFVTGDGTDVDDLSYPGSLMLNRNWTDEYEAVSGLYPSDLGWASNPVSPPGGTFTITTDSGQAALRINTIGTDSQIYYSIDPSFNNATGWVVAWRSRLDTLESGGSRIRACSVDIVDTIRWLRLGSLETAIEDELSANSFTTTTTDVMHNYRIEGQGSAFTVYVDDIPVTGSPWSFGGGDSVSRIRWGDYAGVEDSDSYWVYFKYYNQGSQVPYLSPGEYVSSIYDLGANQNNIGSGATLVFNGSILPSTTITIDTRSGDTVVPDGTWSSWQGLSGNQIQNPTARYLQIRSNLSTSDDTISPQLDDFTVDYCQY